VIYEYVERNFKGMDVSLVLVNMNVTDPNDSPRHGLEKENFRVFEDGRKQEIVTFSSEDVPISIGVIFDMSGSMADKIGQARQAAAQFLRTANPRDEFFMGVQHLPDILEETESSKWHNFAVTGLARLGNILRSSALHIISCTLVLADTSVLRAAQG
jgi:hypothetical protein